MSKPMQAAAEQPALVEVVLDKPHTHKGKLFAKGDKINVTEDQRAWLHKQGVIGGKLEEVSNG